MRIFITIVLGAVLLSACKKDKDPVRVLHHGKVSPNLYSFLFDTGSYWVYRDTITNSLDSTIVTSISKNTYFLFPTGPGQGSSGDEEYFKINYFSYPTNNGYSEEIVAQMISRGLTSGGVTYISTKKIGEKIYNAQIENSIDTLRVEGQEYYNVIKMRVQADSYIIQNYNFYYADNVGIIKKEIRTGETVTDTWNLLRHSTIIKPY